MTVAGGVKAAPQKLKCFFRGGCFVAGTQVVTSEGLKNIEDIEPGDYVLSRNDETGEQGYKRVLDAWETHPPSLIHLFYRRTTETRGRATTRRREGEDHYIVGTSNHPFWSETQQAWIDLGELKTGEYIRLADGALATVEYTEEQWAPEGSTFVTYNFEVADWHTYFVVPEGETDPSTGTWVHNQGIGQYTGKKVKRVGDRVYVLQNSRWHRLNPSGYHRPYLRKNTREAILKNAERDANGRLLDSTTGKPISGKYHIGHETGHEWRNMAAMAERKGWTQKQLNDYANDSRFYRIEDAKVNMSHVAEGP